MVKQMVQSNVIDPKMAANTPLTAYYDNRYVEEVRRSGFLRSTLEITASFRNFAKVCLSFIFIGPKTVW
jgi:hypothetical protein